MSDDDLGENDGTENGEGFILEIKMTGLDWMWEKRKGVTKRSQKIEWLYHRENGEEGGEGLLMGRIVKGLSKTSFPGCGAHKVSSAVVCWQLLNDAC